MSSPPSRAPRKQQRRPRQISEEGENFIPLRKADLRQRLLDDPILTANQREQLEQFCRLLEAAVHYDYAQLLERLKDAYAPFDPDVDTRRQATLPAAQRDERAADFFDAFIDMIHLKSVRARRTRGSRRETPASLRPQMRCRSLRG